MQKKLAVVQCLKQRRKKLLSISNIELIMLDSGRYSLTVNGSNYYSSESYADVSEKAGDFCQLYWEDYQIYITTYDLEGNVKNDKQLIEWHEVQDYLNLCSVGMYLRRIVDNQKEQIK